MATNAEHAAPYIGKYVGFLRSGERLLADAYSMVANRHERDAGVRDMCKQLGSFSERHEQILHALAERYGEQSDDEPERVRSALFHGVRVGGLGKLRDLQDLALLNNHVKLGWSSLLPAAGSLKDQSLERTCTDALMETERQIMWLQTQIKESAPQALTVESEKVPEVSASSPKTPTAAALPEIVWSPLSAGVLVALVGVIAWAAGQAWLLPSLGPSAYLQADNPAHPSSRFYNTFLGHLVGLGMGFLAVALLDAWQAPVVLTEHQVTLSRAFAAALALLATVLICLPLKASHPPAGATALLVALGSIATLQQAMNLAIGALLIAAIGELMRRVRLQGALPRSV